MWHDGTAYFFSTDRKGFVTSTAVADLKHVRDYFGKQAPKDSNLLPRRTLREAAVLIRTGQIGEARARLDALKSVRLDLRERRERDGLLRLAASRS